MRCIPALIVAGVAALLAPAPWRWLGAAAGLVGVVLVWRQSRTRRVDTRRQEIALRDAQHELAECEEGSALQAALLEALATGVVALVGETPVYANRAAIGMLGGHITGAGAVLSPELREAVVVARQGAEGTVEIERGLPARRLRVSARLSDDDTLIVLLVDVTERHRADTVRRDFVAAASHELKTPVAAIQAAAETVLLALDDDPGAVREFSGRVHDNATRLSLIVKDLLDLSRLESHPVLTEPIELGALVGDEIRRFGDSRPQIGLEAESVTVFGNRSDLALAVRNLIDNAVRYTPEDGAIQVRVTGEEGHAVVEVADTGAGIPTESLERIFERFYRVDDARSRAAGGTGLGLSIVKHVAEMHGGAANVDSEVGVGSTFRLQLPSPT